MPSVSLTDHGSMAGAVQLWKATQSDRREAGDRLRGLRRGRPQGAREGQRAPDAARRRQRRLLEPDQALVARLPRGLLLQAARRLGAARAPLAGADRALRLPVAAASARRSRRTASPTPRASSTASRRSSAATTSTSSCRTRTSTCRRASCRSSPSSRRRAACPTVATGDVHYLRDTDARAHEALLCIQSGDSLKNPNHWKFETDHFYFKSPQEMALDFPGHDDAMRRTLEVAERCNVEIELGRILLPKLRRARGPRRVRLSRRAVRERPAKAVRQGDRRAPGAAQVRAEDDQGDGLHRLLPDRLGLHPRSRSRTASRSARAAARPPARSSPTRSRSPTSTRSATT